MKVICKIPDQFLEYALEFFQEGGICMVNQIRLRQVKYFAESELTIEVRNDDEVIDFFKENDIDYQIIS